MQAAPPVELALAAGRLERGVIAALHALAACVTAVWLLRWQLDQGEGGPAAVTGLDRWAWLLPALAGLCAGHAVARRLLPPDAAASRLRWTGRHWALAGNGACEEAVVLDPLDLQIDAGGWVLLHARAASRVHTQALARGAAPPSSPSSTWLVLRRGSTPSSATPWHAMRVALQAHAGVRLSADAPDRVPDPRPDVVHPAGRP